MKDNNNKKIIWLEYREHSMLKEYCKRNGYTMKGFLQSYIRETCKVKKPSGNILKVS
jgi:hypothetical protein